MKSQVDRRWFCTPLIPALGKQRQAYLCEFEACLVCSEFQDSQSYTEKTSLKQEKKAKKTKKKKLLQGQLGLLYREILFRKKSLPEKS